MHPTRAGQPASHELFGLSLMAVMLLISPSCAFPSERLDPIEREAKAVSAEVRAVPEDNNRFALDLYARLRTGQSEPEAKQSHRLARWDSRVSTYHRARGQPSSRPTTIQRCTVIRGGRMAATRGNPNLESSHVPTSSRTRLSAPTVLRALNAGMSSSPRLHAAARRAAARCRRPSILAVNNVSHRYPIDLAAIPSS
jgi:hypothetical protein